MKRSIRRTTTPSTPSLADAQAEVEEAKGLLASANSKLETLIANGGAAFADSIVPDTDERYQRGTAIWFRRTTRGNGQAVSDDRVPAVIVRHSKGWTMCGRTETFSWDDLKREFFSTPLTWFSVVEPADAMGDNLV